MKSLEKYVNAKKKLIVENEKTKDNEKYISKEIMPEQTRIRSK